MCGGGESSEGVRVDRDGKIYNCESGSRKPAAAQSNYCQEEGEPLLLLSRR